jgi:two-component system response regulator AtoC
MAEYSWPGNIRELENLMKIYVLFGSEEDLRATIRNGHEDSLDLELPSAGVVSLTNFVRNAAKKLERRIILRALETHHWNRRKTARALKISYPWLMIKMREMREAGIPPTGGPKACLAAVGESEQEVN